jgi:acetoin utilization deacetylase AcuC-like enzyme
LEPLAAIEMRVRRWLFGRGFVLWYDPRYRLPIPSLEARTGTDARRADFAAWFLLERGAVGPGRVRRPDPIGYEEMARAHSPELLEALDRPETLARIYSVDAGDIRPEEVMTTVRLACGATLQAAQACLRPGQRSVGRR